MIRRFSFLTIVVILLATGASAATFVVPSDTHMVGLSKTIVSGTVQTSWTEQSEEGAIETITKVTVEDVLKGSLDKSEIQIYALGGTVGERTMHVPGMPRFRDGQKVILFLNETKPDRWVVVNLVLGKFVVAKDQKGRKVAER